MHFPMRRPRRLRRSETIRRMVRETVLQVDDLIMPLFVVHGRGIRREIPPMPGNYQLSVDQLTREVKEIAALRIPAVLLFGIPERKDAHGSQAYAKDGIIQQAVRAIKDSVSDLLVITDTCLCEYTSHGHCGVVEEGVVTNDPTLELLAKTAVAQAEAGADIVAPSDMMDGRVGAIREALSSSGFEEVAIMSYAAKYASGFYGPFRMAAESAPQFGDRRSYQMDPANAAEALREVAMDLEEGADIIMVKPALAYLDILWRVRTEFDVPVAAYNVSGEFAMVKAAARLGWLEEEQVMWEILTAIKRAGADLILTYFAKDAARLLRQRE
ncbi:MAG: Delta-aminolevulinic acid dehydratase (porphobilinogen synthase) [candidate division NC10 bacterium CSP1-5]|nr:MAG: Delta-aminolevulinic acid dehydratase (porphobilinogen synthase) [candidate division NC10 bacterium CSP1-5]